MTTDAVLKELSGLEKDVLLLRKILKQSKIKIPAAIDQVIPLVFDAFSTPGKTPSDSSRKSPAGYGLPGILGGFLGGRNGDAKTAAVTVNVINNAGAAVSVNERPNARGGVDIDIMIDQIMAQSLSRPGSQTGRLLNSLFGLSPVLSRR